MQEALFAELAAGARSFACGGPSNAGGLPTTSLRRARKRRHCARSLKHDGGSGSAVFSSTRPVSRRPATRTRPPAGVCCNSTARGSVSLVLAVRESVRSMILLTRYAALENITALLYTGTHVRQYSTLHWTRQTFIQTLLQTVSLSESVRL